MSTRGTSRPPQFGSDWTRRKLDLIERYLDAYTTALKNQPFKLLYIDAFAGTGRVEIATDDEDGRAIIHGSARRAIAIRDKPFDRIGLIEADADRCRELETLRAENPGRSISILNEDANSALQRLTRNWHGWRGVLFLDPFATELEWATIESVADTRALDTWILFPIGAIRRMLPRWKKPEDVNEQWATRLDRIYGGDSWRKLYEPSEQLSLFGPPQERSHPGVDGLLRIYKNQLRDLFGDRFLDESATLRNSRDSPLFELLFVVGHPRGIGPAKDIAGHLLRDI